MMAGTPSFAPATEPVIGNQLPAWTGSPGNVRDIPGPHPPTQPLGGRVGRFDGASGTDPWVARRQPNPRVIAPVIEGQTSSGAGPALGGNVPADGIHPLGYGQGAGRSYGVDGWGWAGRLNAPNREGLVAPGRQSWWRNGFIGFNDQQQVRDRHAYWDRGTQRSGLSGQPWGMPNTYNPDLTVNRARPDLRTVNISVNPQIGSDNSKNQDDLSRPYTWLGQQDGTRQPIYGGVPGLWQQYGNRGLTSGIHDPSNGEGGPVMIFPGPPHGLHSDTLPSNKQTIDRYRATPQMRPVRFDRPDNSRTAGQSFSQTVQMQGETGSKVTVTHSATGISGITGRGWSGRAGIR